MVEDWICEEEVTGTVPLMRKMLLTSPSCKYSHAQLHKGEPCFQLQPGKFSIICLQRKQSDKSVASDLADVKAFGDCFEKVKLPCVEE